MADELTEEMTLFAAWTTTAWVGDGTTRYPYIAQIRENWSDPRYSHEEFHQACIHYYNLMEPARDGPVIKLSRPGTPGVHSPLYRINMRNRFAALLLNLGILNNKEIPRCIITATLLVRYWAAGGLICADGCLLRQDGRPYAFQVVCSVEQRPYMDQYQVMLRSIGCKTSRITYSPKYRDVENDRVYTKGCFVMAIHGPNLYKIAIMMGYKRIPVPDRANLQDLSRHHPGIPDAMLQLIPAQGLHPQAREAPRLGILQALDEDGNIESSYANGFNIRRLGTGHAEGAWVGIEVHGSGRVLTKDFIVVQVSSDEPPEEEKKEPEVKHKKTARARAKATGFRATEATPLVSGKRDMVKRDYYAMEYGFGVEEESQG